MAGKEDAQDVLWVFGNTRQGIRLVLRSPVLAESNVRFNNHEFCISVRKLTGLRWVERSLRRQVLYTHAADTWKAGVDCCTILSHRLQQNKATDEHPASNTSPRSASSGLVSCTEELRRFILVWMCGSAWCGTSRHSQPYCLLRLYIVSLDFGLLSSVNLQVQAVCSGYQPSCSMPITCLFSTGIWVWGAKLQLQQEYEVVQQQADHGVVFVHVQITQVGGRKVSHDEDNAVSTDLVWGKMLWCAIEINTHCCCVEVAATLGTCCKQSRVSPPYSVQDIHMHMHVSDFHYAVHPMVPGTIIQVDLTSALCLGCLFKAFSSGWLMIEIFGLYSIIIAYIQNRCWVWQLYCSWIDLTG